MPAHSALGTAQLLDVADQHLPEVGGALDRVGMTQIEVPLRIREPGGQIVLTPARADAFVSLDDARAKGIHMSRLFLLLQETLGKEPLTVGTLETLLRGFVDSHHPISASSFVDLSFDYCMQRRALRSENTGWRFYPARVSAALERDRFSVDQTVRVAYSSTCPCSAALSRQHIQQQFIDQFGSETSLETSAVAEWLGTAAALGATPHSQRSYADVRITVDPTTHELPWTQLIDLVEDALGTPVQAAVKRVDEQEFARLNGTNLMFCEDAARRVRARLESAAFVRALDVRIEHQESLHPHNAVSQVSVAAA